MDIKRTSRDAATRVGLVGEMLGYLAKRRLWFIIPMVTVLLLVGLLAAAWLWSRNGYGYGMMGGYGFPWGMHGFGGRYPFGGMHTFGGGVLMLVFWAVVIGGGAWLLTGLARQGRG